jgi:MYXO-CTERM domain-containing protein
VDTDVAEMRLGTILLCAAALTPAVPGIAAAEAPRRVVAPWEPAALFDIVAGPDNADGYQLARQVLPPQEDAPASAIAASRTVYLNKNGITLTPGVNDSRLNRSSIPTQQVTIPPWNVSASTWATTVSCMREIFAPFNVTIVDSDPGDVPHIEAVFGGVPSQLGMATKIAGVSPFTTDCAVIENSIVFTFTGALPADPILACEIQAQEVAHSFGLDHVLLPSDPMTYQPYQGRRWFQNKDASCGEDTARPCGLNGSVCRPKQNSVAMLLSRVGLRGQAGDTVPPTVAITSPQNGATVATSFDVSFTATDNARVAMASLYIDGVPSGTAVMAPFSIRASGLSPGMHKLRIVATDGIQEQAREIAVTVSASIASDDEGVTGCSAGGGGGGSARAGAGLLIALAALTRRRRR